MMIFVKCHQCAHSWFVQGEPTDVNMLLSTPEWVESFPCPTPLCSGRAMRAGGLAEAKAHGGAEPITLEAFYRGIMGLGNGAPTDSVRKLLFESKVVAMDASPKNGRTIIKSLTFTDGTKMHFGISQAGACIYNIEEVKSEIHTDGAVEGSDSDREETGRVTKNKIPIREFGSESSREFHSITASESAGAKPVSAMPTTSDVPAGAVTRPDE